MVEILSFNYKHVQTVSFHLAQFTLPFAATNLQACTWRFPQQIPSSSCSNLGFWWVYVQKQPKRSVSGAKWDSFQLISNRPSKKSPSVKALRGLGSISITMSNYVDIMYWWISWGMAHTVVDMIRLNVHVLVRNFHQSWYHKSNLGWPLQCSCRTTTGWPLHRFSTLATFQSLGQMLWP